ncbi:MAG: cysteine desulfurase family protein [Pseudomonadota bacterium]
MKVKHYLDYNATAHILPQAASIISELQLLPLNPSSGHAYGRQAKGIIEDARREIAEIIGVFASEIIFTASASEANNQLLKSCVNMPILVSAIEHPSILKTAQHIVSPIIIPVCENGVVDLQKLADLLPINSPFLVSVMLANNETGVIQPIEEIAKIVHAKGGMLHCDAVQALGKIEVDFATLSCDAMTLSGHKIGGGVGGACLVARNDIALQQLINGGGQELNRRAGTENVAAIAGFAEACKAIDLKKMLQIRTWLAAFEEIIEQNNGVIVGKQANRLPNTTCAIMPNMPAQTQLINCDLEGVAVSSGSACSSGRIEPSYVLKAMNIEYSLLANAIRFSDGHATTERDIIAASDVWLKIAARRK